MNKHDILKIIKECNTYNEVDITLRENGWTLIDNSITVPGKFQNKWEFEIIDEDIDDFIYVLSTSDIKKFLTKNIFALEQ